MKFKLAILLIILNVSDINACVNDIGCDGNGVCVMQTCLCFPRFVTFPQNNTIGCNYLQKSKKTTFLLALLIFPLINFGTSELYIGNINHGIAMMSLNFVLIFSIIITIHDTINGGLCKDPSFVEYVITPMIFIMIPLLIMAWGNILFTALIPDAVDGNGVPLFDDFGM